MTAQAIEGSRERCLEHDRDDFVSKPIKLDDLKRVLDRWLHQNPREPLIPAAMEA